MSVYWHGGGWEVATTGTPDACGPVGSASLTFRDLFWQTVEAEGLAIDPEAARATHSSLSSPAPRTASSSRTRPDR
jgi:hypothetical protein